MKLGGEREQGEERVGGGGCRGATLCQILSPQVFLLKESGPVLDVLMGFHRLWGGSGRPTAPSSCENCKWILNTACISPWVRAQAPGYPRHHNHCSTESAATAPLQPSANTSHNDLLFPHLSGKPNTLPFSLCSFLKTRSAGALRHSVE